METPKTDKIHNTVILTDRFAERRAQPAPAAGQAVDDEPLQPLKAGERIDRYVILHVLGGGGMGLVYKALDTELNRVVALKVLPPQLSRHPDYLSRFRAEARAQAQLNNPHVVTLYSLLELPDGEVLVLEYLEGQTLAQRLRTQGPLPVELTVDIFGQALLGLEHIHSKGVIHRDLKPSNIFLTQDGQVKLMDFGVAKRVDQPDPSQPGAMVGTLLYISPEQINGRETDCRSDIYTLGVSLFESVTGRLPFERRTDYALMHAHVQENPPRPKQFQRRLPAELEWIILKALEKDPERRFRDAAEFRTALQQVAPGSHHMPQARADVAALRHTLMPSRFTRKNGLLGSFGFDILLIGAVIALLYGLGILPFKSRTTPPAEAEKAMPARLAPRHTPAAKKPPITKSPPVAKSATTKPRNTVPAPKPPANNNLDSLRDAWGG